MSDDLYAGLTLPTRAKRSAPAASAAEEVHSRTSHENAHDEKRRKKSTAAQPLDLPATVAKLKNYMLVDKKFAKASRLFARLADEKMDAQTHTLFMDALAEVVAAKSDKWSGSKDLETLVQQIVAKHEALAAGANSAAGDSARYATLVANWKLLAVTHAQLFTDETYQFVKAAKVVKTRLESIAPDANSADTGESDATDRTRDHNTDTEGELALVMPLLRTLFAKHTTSWARAMVESVLAVATQKRLRFSETHREEVDAWTTAIQERRSAPAVARSAGSDARRNIVTEQGSQATVKVGRVNHPLFNREL
ncbi:hypothetical protein PybrP1_003597 [[Pythium] brassicae (nom. inval.)]|nr:hypothetical protein PybrP1_003597 [[Pythium] brassicae (nom. inval.)]